MEIKSTSCAVCKLRTNSGDPCDRDVAFRHPDAPASSGAIKLLLEKMAAREDEIIAEDTSWALFMESVLLAWRERRAQRPLGGLVRGTGRPSLGLCDSCRAASLSTLHVVEALESCESGMFAFDRSGSGRHPCCLDEQAREMDGVSHPAQRAVCHAGRRHADVWPVAVNLTMERPEHEPPIVLGNAAPAGQRLSCVARRTARASSSTTS